jgi:hypothetical protein
MENDENTTGPVLTLAERYVAPAIIIVAAIIVALLVGGAILASLLVPWR